MGQLDFAALAAPDGPDVLPRNWNQAKPAVRIEAYADGYAIYSPFKRAFVDDLKAQVPYTARCFDGQLKAWIVDAAHVQIARDLLQQHYGLAPEIESATLETRLVSETLRLEYLGACKEREGQAEPCATGFVNGRWDALFPEAVLRSWFEGTTSAGTLYAVLGCQPEADLEAIKKAYKRMARVTHPDVNKEPDAQEQFLALQRAYDTLSDPDKRKRYDVGLAFAGQGQLAGRMADRYGYRAPLRCGLVRVEGSRTMRGLNVSRILSWKDIVDGYGRVMASSWPKGAETFVIEWVEPGSFPF